MKSTLRSRWKPPAILAAILVVGVVATCLLLRKAQARKEFVGKTDAESGLRCRFTVSAGWQQKEDADPVGDPWSVIIDDSSFVSRPFPFRQWIDKHVLHRPIGNPVETYMRTTRGQYLPKGFHLENGYPEPRWYDFKILLHKHLRIDGYPATLVDLENSDYHYRWTALLVYVPDHAILYEVTCSAEAPDFDQAFQEIQAITSSFHVEKGAVASDDKR